MQTVQNILTRVKGFLETPRDIHIRSGTIELGSPTNHSDQKKMPNSW